MRYIYGAVGVIGVTVLVFVCLVALQRMLGVIAYAREASIREKFTRDLSFARQLAREYFRQCPKDRYATEVESWRQIQSQNIEFTMKRLREPVRPV
jgi:hypothetical protein